MFCNACGNPNPDGSKFCSACGKPLMAQTTARPQPQPQPQPQPASTQEQTYSAEESFRASWRNLIKAPASLIVLILYSVYVLINAINAGEMLESLSGILNFLGSDALLQGELIYIAAVVPGFLIALGMWMLYLEGFSNPTKELRGTGFQLIKIVNIVSLILGVICLISVFVEINDLFDGVNSEIRAAITEALWEEYGLEILILIAAVVTWFVMTLKTITMLEGMHTSVAVSYPTTDHMVGVAVYQFISGGAAIFMLLKLGMDVSDIAELPLSTIMGLFMPFVFGAMLLRYKNFMDEMYVEITSYKNGTNASSASSSTSYNDVPTWKRVSMDNTEEWTCAYCGHKNPASSTACTLCGAEKR